MNTNQMSLTGIDFLDEVINTYNQGFRTLEFPMIPKIDVETEVIVGKIPDFLASMFIAESVVKDALLKKDIHSDNYTMFVTRSVNLSALVMHSVLESYRKCNNPGHLALRSSNIIVKIDVQKLIIKTLGMPKEIKENGALSSFIDGVINFYNFNHSSVVTVIYEYENKHIFSNLNLSESDWRSIDELTDIHQLIKKFNEMGFAGIVDMDRIIEHTLLIFASNTGKLKKIFDSANPERSFDYTGPEIIDDDELH